jgi:hypothetical protein
MDCLRAAYCSAFAPETVREPGVFRDSQEDLRVLVAGAGIRLLDCYRVVVISELVGV